MSFCLPLKEVSPVVKLTAKQEKYVQGLVAGLSQRQAYRQAYDNSKEWKDRTVDSRASELLKKSDVLGRYDQLMNEHKEKALWTREEAVTTLKWLLNKSMQSIENQDEGYVRQGTSNAIVAAIKELNELELLYPLKQKQVEKIDSEINKDETAEGKLAEYLKVLGDTIDET